MSISPVTPVYRCRAVYPVIRPGQDIPDQYMRQKRPLFRNRGALRGTAADCGLPASVNIDVRM